MQQRRVSDQLDFVDGFIPVRATFLSEVDALIDWAPVEQALAGIYSATKGRPSYPLLTLFKALLVQQWYSLSDYELEEALLDRISFRRFVGLGVADAVPDHSTISRFRTHASDRMAGVMAALNAQFEQKGLVVKKGTLMDASFIKAASGKREVDPEAGRYGLNKDGSVSGYKVHVGVDEGSGLVRRVIVTPANVNDTEVADELVSGDEAAVYADKAYDKRARRERLESNGVFVGIMHRPSGPRKLTEAQTQFNKAAGKVRCAVERTFATLKNHYGMRRTRYRGLARTATQLNLAIIAMNLKRATVLA